MRNGTLTMALAGAALCGLIAAGAARAQTAPAAPTAEAPATAAPAPAATKAKAKKPASSASTVAVTVVNSRAAGLTELQAAVSGSVAWKKVLGALKPGKKAVALLPRGADCQVDLHGAFDDGQTMEATGVDACANKTLNLKD
jgi:hypothetical protein